MRALVSALVVVLVPLVASADPARVHRPATLPDGRTIVPLCPDHSCRTLAVADAHGNIIHASTPGGFGAQDIQGMYDIDPSLGAGLTVAVVDAYGYVELESDLAVYRTQFGLPACSVASGCLTILNNVGSNSPLLPDSDKGWIGETALDVQMVSAACPMCKIVVVQADSNGQGLFVGQQVVAKLDVDTISDSWSSDEYEGIDALEGAFNLPGVGVFAATGDDGYNAVAQYPSTSAYAIAVGGTAVGSDGTTPVAWDSAGSSCSTVIGKPSYQPGNAACDKRAAADVSAFAAPIPGVATYIASQGGWSQVGGTSAATPITAALMAAAGHADARPAFIYKHTDAYNDVTMGTNGTCGSTLCNAGIGWDGPTGLGTPDQSKLKLIGDVAGMGPAVSFTYPTDGLAVDSAFSIQVAPDTSALWVDIQIDGTRVGKLNIDPWTLQAPPTLAPGQHTITAIAYDLDHNSQTASVGVTLGSGSGSMGGGSGGGCSTSGIGGGEAGGSFALIGIVVGGRLLRRRRA